MKRRTYGKDVKNLLYKLLIHHTQFFNYDLMNSEGRKVFEEMARMLVYEHPEMKKMIVKIRRNPTLDNVVKLAKLVLGDEASNLPLLATQGLYYDIFQNNY